MPGEREYHYKVDISEGRWLSYKVMLEDEHGELHDTGQKRFFSSSKSATQYKKMLEGGAGIIAVFLAIWYNY